MFIKVRRFKHIFIFVILILFSGNCYSKKDNSLLFHGGYTFETFKDQKSCAVYLSIFNNTEKDFIIRSIETSVAKKAEIHDVNFSDNIVKMIMTKNFKIEKNTQIFFQPGGKHIMLMGLNDGLYDGQSFNLRFYFDNEEMIETQILVVNKKLRENYLN